MIDRIRKEIIQTEGEILESQKADVMCVLAAD